MGEWYDDEFYFLRDPWSLRREGWAAATCSEIDETGVGTGSAPTNMLSLGPYHGTGVKSQNGDVIDIKRLVIWAR